MKGVLAHHADDIVMFDVPPPNDGVRGLDAYRETWSPFLTWQEQGGSFEIAWPHCARAEGSDPSSTLSLDGIFLERDPLYQTGDGDCLTEPLAARQLRAWDTQLAPAFAAPWGLTRD